MIELNANLRSLLTELTIDSEGRGYAGMTPEQIAADLNELRYVALSERMINKRTLYAFLGIDAGVRLLRGMRALIGVTTDDLEKEKLTEAYDMLTDVSAGGVDISLTESRAMIAQFAASGLLTVEEAAVIKALAETRQNRAQEIGYNEITAAMVERCREVM